jgi:hypothetical protein
MKTKTFLEAKQKFQKRITSLENDARRAYYPIDGIAYAPFPIIMYVFATIDYFSSFWAGWNDKNNRPEEDKRSQTKRISDFLEKYLIYPQKETQLAINIWRHKLMHTGEPRILGLKNTYYTWLIASQVENHMTLKEVDKKNYQLQIGVKDIIDDLKEGIFGVDGYYDNLRKEKQLQHQYELFDKEINKYKFNFEK